MSSAHRREVAEYSLALHARGWVANHDGNVSLRPDGSDRFLITPTALSKRRCLSETLVECDLDGKALGKGKPPSEVLLHVAAYRARGDVRAVIHAHPPSASAFSLARVELGPVVMPEVVVSLGERVPLVALFVPKDPAVVPAVSAALGAADGVLLAGNGVLTVGPDLETAYLRVELVEHYARILLAARSAGLEPAALGAAERAALLELRKQAGLLREPAPAAAEAGSKTVRAVVAEEVRRALGGQR